MLKQSFCNLCSSSVLVHGRLYTDQRGKKSKNPNKHVSFGQQTIAYMEPFTLDVFISKQYISASLTHRVACKQVAISQLDIPACLALGQILADQAGEADVYTASYTPRERDKFEGKIEAVVQSLIDSGIDIKVYLDRFSLLEHDLDCLHNS
ncbi:hypothetical protein ACJRO7_011285 [Eucalyptus globulus]|uniref:Uncharacterized protein n=1 Tax=Eucalyptus globulus TaxID=34317 RepID=A0ABD3LEV9_EUCGL